MPPRLADPRNYGVVFPSHYFEQWRGKYHPEINKTYAIACQWVGDNFVITVPDLLPRMNKWPKDSKFNYGLTRFKRYWRRSTYNHCIKALAEFSGLEGVRMHHPSGRLLGLWERLVSMEIVRLSPRGQKMFDPDALPAWAHQLRDGMQDVYAGYVMMNNGRPKWLGQEVDNRAHAMYRHVDYNEVQESDCYGHQLIYKFHNVEVS